MNDDSDIILLIKKCIKMYIDDSIDKTVIGEVELMNIDDTLEYLSE